VSIWAIADIHASPVDDVSGQPDKPMEVFGPQWTGHLERIERVWASLVQPRDTVIIVGDVDWSLHLEEALPTLQRIARWNGRKILVRGNHDFWWSSKATNRVRRAVPETIELLHNNAIEVEGFNIVGTKGSAVPGGVDWTAVDAKLLNREMERLKLSLQARDPARPTIAALHYPPFYPSAGRSPYVDLLEEAGVSLCVYGHLHGSAGRSGPHGIWNGIDYVLTAADYVGFRPVRIAHGGQLTAHQ
jgi:predicted phosphohydrolase